MSPAWEAYCRGSHLCAKEDNYSCIENQHRVIHNKVENVEKTPIMHIPPTKEYD